MTQETISIVGLNGQNWVRVCALGEDFLIDIHDLEINGKKLNLDKPTIQQALKEQGYAELTKKQGLLVCALLDEINAKMKEAGGGPFEHDWYAAADYDSGYTWHFHGRDCCFSIITRYYRQFRCRPVIKIKENQSLYIIQLNL